MSCGGWRNDGGTSLHQPQLTIWASCGFFCATLCGTRLFCNNNMIEKIDRSVKQHVVRRIKKNKKGRTIFGRDIITSIMKLACSVQLHKTSTKHHFSQGKKDQIQTLLTYFKEFSKKRLLWNGSKLENDFAHGTTSTWHNMSKKLCTSE